MLNEQQKVKVNNALKEYGTSINWDSRFKDGDKFFYHITCKCGEVRRVSQNTVAHYVNNGRTYGNKFTGLCKKCGMFKFEDRTLAAKNDVYYHARICARDRNISFTIERDAYLNIASQDCFYCGGKPSQTRKANSSMWVHNGVDRVDSSIGYEESNCVPCCAKCNFAKHVMSLSDFVSHISKVYVNLKSKGLIV